VEHIEIIGIKVLPVDIEEALCIAAQNINKRQGGYFCFLNLFLCMKGVKEGRIKQVLNNSSANFVDGMGIKLSLKLFGYKFNGRARGTDFMLKLCEYAAKNGLKIYLYGNTEDTLVTLKRKLISYFPELEIVGYYSPPFRELTEDENEEIIKKINETKPDIIFVSLGSPKQELWMSKNKDKTNATMFGVGAAFDFITGNVRQAPFLMQKLGLEWLYRLPQQPKKTIYRMSFAIEFALRVLIQFINKRLF